MIFIRLLFTRSLNIFVLIFGIVFGCIPLSHAIAQKNCPAEMNIRAVSKLADASGNWHSLLRHQRTFASCDDGELGEGYSEAVVYLFAQRWDQFSVFSALAKKRPSFQRWAIRHIDATTSDEDLNRIILNATTCVANVKAENLCKIIRQAAVNALKESLEMRQ